MYGHLDYNLPVADGDIVERGQQIGAVLLITDSRGPSHLHFEIRNFLENREVNGTAPRYNYACGYQCAPGPGFWPISDAQLPVDMGWRNPMHAIARRIYPDGVPNSAEVVVAASPASATTTVWSSVAGNDRQKIAELDLTPGDQYPLLDIHAWAENTTHTTAEAYHVWYRIGLPDDRDGWVVAMAPSTEETGTDGRPSTIILNFVPNVITPEGG
jgi:hypothetical protein